jgi:DNA-binding response OmpR family regulator
MDIAHASGLEFLSWCRREPAWRDLPIVLLASQKSENFHAIALELGATEFFTQPYPETELLAAIATLVWQQTLKQTPAAPAT